MKTIRVGYKETEIGVIPKEWNVVQIGEVIKYLKSGLSRKLSDSDIGIPCLRSSNINDGKLCLIDLKYWYKQDPQGANVEDYILNEGDILVNFINSIAQIGKACVFKKTSIEAIYTTNIFRVKVNLQKFDNEYFLYNTQTKSYGYQVSLITKPAVNQASFTTGDFKSILFPMPPLQEQQRIAEILSAIDEHIEKLDKTIEDYQLLKKGMMKKLLTEGIGHTEFKETEIGRIPESWEVKKLNEVVDVRDGTHDSPKQLSEGIPLITSKNLKPTGLDLSELTFISEEDHKSISKRSKVDKGDIIFAMIGTIGNPVIMDVDFEVSIKNVALLKFADCSLNNVFIKNLLDSAIILDQFSQKKTGGVQKFVSLGLIRNILIPIPTLQEQQKIAEILSNIDLRLNLYLKEREDFILLKKSLMELLLTGELRVIHQ